MSDSDPQELFEDRPTLWPHTAPERLLPSEVEQRLRKASLSVAADGPYAVALCEEAIALARATGDDGETVRTLFRAASIVLQARRPDRAYVLCLEAQQALERRDDRWRATRILLLRGQCWLDVGEHERAMTLIAEAAERFRVMENRADLARCHAAMAMAHRLAGDLEQAIAVAEQAVGLVNPPHDRHLDISLRHNEALMRLERGRQLAQRGEVQQAQAEYARASAVLPDVRHVESPRGQPDGGQVLQNIAQVAMAVGDDATVLLALRRLAEWARENRSRLERGLVWLQMAELQRERGRARAAVSCARAAVKHLSTLHNEPRLVTALGLLAELLEAQGEHRGAYEAYAESSRTAAEQQREAIALRAEMLALDRDAEQELRSTEQTLAYAQRLSNVGHLVASINHELNQPMASIRLLAETALELIERGEAPDEVLASMRSMLKLSTRLTDLTAQLAAFPARRAAQGQRLSLRQAVLEALGMLRSRLLQTQCEIIIGFDDAAAHGDEGQVVRVIANLVNNALDVLEPVAARRIEFGCVPDGEFVVLSVADNGPGLAPPVLERLFQPFFSTKAAGRGLGLGLALSRDVVREMGGELLARNAVEGGAVFEVRLPAEDPTTVPGGL